MVINTDMLMITTDCCYSQLVGTGTYSRDWEDIKRIESIQRRAARWVLGDYSPYSSVTDMIGKLGWRTLEQRSSDSRLVLFYKIIYGYVAVPLPSYVIPLSSVSRTFHPLAYRQIPATTNYYKYSLAGQPSK